MSKKSRLPHYQKEKRWIRDGTRKRPWNIPLTTVVREHKLFRLKCARILKKLRMWRVHVAVVSNTKFHIFFFQQKLLTGKKGTKPWKSNGPHIVFLRVYSFASCVLFWCRHPPYWRLCLWLCLWQTKVYPSCRGYTSSQERFLWHAKHILAQCSKQACTSAEKNQIEHRTVPYLFDGTTI